MRNTKEWYFFIDRLVQNDKKLYFYLDRKFYSPDDALITGIKAILAEDFSRSLSKNINNAHRKRQESGSSIVITSRTWGYDKKNKQVAVNEKESGMVQFIYEMASLNYGTRTIAKMLQEKGYYNRNGGKIAEQTVRRIIRNPLYKGTAVMNVLHRNFETKRTERNSREKWIYHEHIVPAIVSEELWETANRLMDQRSRSFVSEDFKVKVTGSKKNADFLTGKIVCGLCQNTYWRRTSVNAKGAASVYWDCREYVRRGRKTKNNRTPEGSRKPQTDVKDSGCDNIHIKEKDMDHLMYELAEKLYVKPGNDIFSAALSILKQAVGDSSEYESAEESLKGELEKLSASRDTLLDRYLENKIADDIYYMKDSSLKTKMNEKEQEILRVQNLKRELSNQEERIREIEQEIKTITDYDLSVSDIKKHIEKIAVYPDILIFHFDIFDNISVRVQKKNYRKTDFHICL